MKMPEFTAEASLGRGQFQRWQNCKSRALSRPVGAAISLISPIEHPPCQKFYIGNMPYCAGRCSNPGDYCTEVPILGTSVTDCKCKPPIQL